MTLSFSKFLESSPLRARLGVAQTSFLQEKKKTPCFKTISERENKKNSKCMPYLHSNCKVMGFPYFFCLVGELTLSRPSKLPQQHFSSSTQATLIDYSKQWLPAGKQERRAAKTTSSEVKQSWVAVTMGKA